MSLALPELYGASCMANHTIRISFYENFRWQKVFGIWIVIIIQLYQLQTIENRYTLIWCELCFRLRYYSVYILISTGAILVMAAAVHFFVETVANEDPCENNNNKYIIGKSQQIIGISATKWSYLYHYFIFIIYLVFHRLENLSRILLSCCFTSHGQYFLLLDISANNGKRVTIQQKYTSLSSQVSI